MPSNPFPDEKPKKEPEAFVIPEPQIIKTVEDVPAELERVTGEDFYSDRLKIDQEWLMRRAGKRK